MKADQSVLRRAVLSSLAFFLFAFSAQAQKRTPDYELVAAAPSEAIYIDPQTIQKVTEDVISYSDLAVLAVWQPVNGELPAFASTLWNVNCKTRASKRIASDVYGRTPGRRLGTALLVEQFKAVPPATLGDRTLSFVCGPDHKGASKLSPGVGAWDIAATVNAYFAAHPPPAGTASPRQ